MGTTTSDEQDLDARGGATRAEEEEADEGGCCPLSEGGASLSSLAYASETPDALLCLLRIVEKLLGVSVWWDDAGSLQVQACWLFLPKSF